jgi:hypothetical protein
MQADCPIERTRPIYRERDKETNEFGFQVKHKQPLNKFVLNLGQMRDSEVLDSFRLVVHRENRDEIIRKSAEEVIKARKVKAQAEGGKGNDKGKGKGRETRIPSALGRSSLLAPSQSREETYTTALSQSISHYPVAPSLAIYPQDQLGPSPLHQLYQQRETHAHWSSSPHSFIQQQPTPSIYSHIYNMQDTQNER